jgi:nitrogen fixation protein
MVPFRFDQVIPHPRQLVFETYRDKLPLLVPYLPNCERIEVVTREDRAGGVVQLKNLWHASVKVPRAARRFVKDELMSWYDHATWDPQAYAVDWRFELRVFTEAATCGGRNRFEIVDERSTRYVLSGQLDLDLTKLPFVPRMFSGLAPRVEKWILDAVQPNLESIGAAVGKYLDQHPAR